MQFDHRKRFVGADQQRRSTRAQVLNRVWEKNQPRPEPVDSAPAHGIPRPDTSHIEVKD
jgi:hypothetical protein